MTNNANRRPFFAPLDPLTIPAATLHHHHQQHDEPDGSGAVSLTIPLSPLNSNSNSSTSPPPSFPSAPFTSTTLLPTISTQHHPHNNQTAGRIGNSNIGSATPAAPATPPATAAAAAAAASFEPVVDSVPLLEELGISFTDIARRSMRVLNPLSSGTSGTRSAAAATVSMMDGGGGGDGDGDGEEVRDLSGVLLFCLALAVLMLLRGKVQFGAIYGCAVLGCLAVYLLVNVMRDEGVDMHRTASILGYCLLPVVLLAAASLVVPRRVAVVLGWAAVAWCTWSATRMFVAQLKMERKAWLLAYPLALVYSTFALITVF